MAMDDTKKRILLSSLVLTVVIFASAILLNYGLDFVRINSVAGVMQEHEIHTESYLVEQNFMNMFGGDVCAGISSRIGTLKEEMKEVGNELGSYGKISIFNKEDFDYLKRKYFLLQLKMYTLVTQADKQCNLSFSPLLFFYKIDDDASERQGYILSDLSKERPNDVIVLTFDIDYEDEPLLKLLKQRYNITQAPSIVANGSEVLEGLSYRYQIESFIGTKNG